MSNNMAGRQVTSKQKAIYVVAALMNAVCGAIDKTDSLRVTHMQHKMHVLAKRYEARPEIKKAGLAEVAIRIWNDVGQDRDYLIEGDSLHLMLEYLSNLVTKSDHQQFYNVPQFVTYREVSHKEKLMLSKLSIGLGESLRVKYGHGFPTEPIRKMKTKRPRDKKAPKVKKVKRKGVPKRIKRGIAPRRIDHSVRNQFRL